MKKVLLWVISIVGVLMAAAVVFGFMNIALYGDAAVPPRDDLPNLPAGLSFANENEGCGSGNCYREFDVVSATEDSVESIRAQLPAEEECAAHSLVDRRPLCVGYRIQGAVVRGYVSLGKWWN